MQKSLSYYNYINAKRKAEQEEPIYESYMPETPKVKETKVVPLSAGVFNMVRQFRP